MIDFEYNHSNDEKLNLVCCSYILSTEPDTTISYWLHNDPNEKNKLREKLIKLNFDGYIFTAHYVAAEAHCFISLDLDPLCFDWIDTRTEFRCILNHSDIMYGKHLIKGKEVFTERPSYFDTDKSNNAKPEANLASMIYKMCNYTKIDTEHKDKMRDLIISAPDEFTPDEKKSIIEYCESDVKYLEPAMKTMLAKYVSLFAIKPENVSTLLKEMLLRGQFGANTAKMYSLGYPIDYEATKNFSESVEDILSDIARDINRQFPDIKPFRYDLKDKRFKTNTKHIKAWIGKSEYKDRWMLTDGKDYSLSLDAFGMYFKFSHSHPEGNFGAQILRYLKTKQNMNGFRPSLKGDKSFWNSVGSDKRVRPFLNPYGSQSARSQPSATSFIPLKAAWMRSLIVPPIGKAMCELDYGSQEYLVAALLARDKAMIASYESGDVYLAFAKLAKMVPKEATKSSHPKERQAAKAAVLAISYSMTGKGLAYTLSQQTGEEWGTVDAQELIDNFHDVYPEYAAWKDEIQSKYSEDGFLKLKDGWYLWGENPNFRSVGNFPIQGGASDILRNACHMAQTEKLDVTYLLHDAGYIQYDVYDFEKIDILKNCLRNGFINYFDEDIRDLAKIIRIDGSTWSKEYTDGEIITPGGLKIKTETTHIDERSVDAYKQFSPYFEKNKAWELL